MGATCSLSANGSKGHHKFTLSVEETRTSVSNNTSALSFAFKLAPIQTTWNWAQWGGSITYSIDINGAKYSGSIPDYDGYSTVTLKSGNLTVAHNADGTKSINVGFSVSDSTGQSYTCGSARNSTTMVLTPIPRAATITSVSNITLGNKCGVTFTPTSTSYYYDIRFSIGDWAVSSGPFQLSNTSEYTYGDCTIPASADIYKHIPSSTTGTMTATLSTYSDENKTKQIGSDSVKTFTVTIPNSVKPSIGDAFYEIYTNGHDYVLQNHTRITIRVSGCAAGSGSTIKSYTISKSGVDLNTSSTKDTSWSYTTPSALSTVGTHTYTVKITDARGRTATKTVDVYCNGYSKPTISLSAIRTASSDGTTESQDGTYIRCACNFTHSNLNSTNHVTVKIEYKQSTASSWTSVTAVNQQKNTTSKTHYLSSIAADKIYLVRATVSDKYFSNTTSQITIFSAQRVLNVKSNGNGIAFGQLATADNLLESRWPIKTHGGLTIGESSQSSIPSAGIHVHDVRNATITPDSFGEQNVNFYFDAFTNGGTDWYSAMHTKGWKGNTYAAWELARHANNTQYGRLKYRSGTASVGWEPWQNVETSRVLYSNDSNTGTSVSLSDNTSNYSCLEIFYRDNHSDSDRQYLRKSVRVYNPYGKIVELSFIEPNAANNAIYVRSAYYSITGTSMTIGRYNYTTLKNNEPIVVQHNNYIYITQVIGYR